MSETRNASYVALLPTLKGKRLAVFNAIKESPRGATLFELCDKLCWEVNRVSGRVTELCKAGLIDDSCCRRENPKSGKYAVVWKAGSEVTH